MDRLDVCAPTTMNLVMSYPMTKGDVTMEFCTIKHTPNHTLLDMTKENYYFSLTNK
jgi:hypothetical protein